VETASRPSGKPSAEMARAVGVEKRLIRPEFQSQLSGVLPNSNSKWCVSDPLPPSAPLPLTEPVQVMQNGPVLGKNRVKTRACRNNFETGHRNRS
jgi:hypothetical protein